MSAQRPHPPEDMPPAEPVLGRPVRFAAGPFVGHTVRVQLTEIQKAESGRKYGVSDRRPLDPPPVVRLRLYEVLDAHTPRRREEELADLTELESYGFVCHLDLFPVPTPPDGALPLWRLSTDQLWQFPSIASSDNTSHDRAPFPTLRDGPVASTSTHFSAWDEGPGLYYHAPAPSPGDGLPADRSVATHMHGVPVFESSKCTRFVVGTTFSPSSLIDYQRVRQVMFVFPDIAVKEEGEYFLRYRAFNTLYPVAGAARLPVLAEGIGGPFRVYTTNAFPGLRASTDLTKRISRFGVHVNTRAQERKRRKSAHAGSPAAAHDRREPHPIAPASAAPLAGTSASADSAYALPAQPPLPHPRSTGISGNRRGRGGTL